MVATFELADRPIKNPKNIVENKRVNIVNLKVNANVMSRDQDIVVGRLSGISSSKICFFFLLQFFEAPILL